MITTLKPSENMDDYFQYEDLDPFFGSSLHTGKWFAFVDRDDIDRIWDLTQFALYSRHLGPAAKVSTIKPNPLQQYAQLENGRTHMIIAYSRDFSDQEDRLRIAQGLREHCGLADKTLYYKTDQTTHAGSYGENCWYAILDAGQTEERLLNVGRAG